MASSYSSFLESPSTSLLASGATISYITTTTTISEPTAILKHFAAQSKQLDTKERKILSKIESADGLCMEMQTTILFKNGGGAYLPQLDENLLDERSVTFPMIHVVNFDGEGKIKSVRLYWDQATLLRQVEAIGRTGRNWPIRDGTAQIKTIKSAIVASGATVGADVSSKPPASGKPNDVVIGHHKRGSVSATRDPHASLALFAPRDPNEGANDRYSGPKHASRESAKPAPRDYGDLFAGEENGTKEPPSRSRSPTKADGVFMKAGAGKHFSDNRLFDERDEAEPPRSPERKKTYKEKYEHFAFGDGEDAPPPPASRPTTSSANSTKAMSHFSFDEFATPPKPNEKNARVDYNRHWGTDIDEGYKEAAPQRPIVHEARKDAETHFQFGDDSPVEQKPKSLQRQKGMGLYHNPVLDDLTPKQSSRNTTSTNNSRRNDELNAHYSMADSSPATPAGNLKKQQQHAQRGDMESNWSFESPEIQVKKIYKTAGDGMGSRKGGRSWGIGDESDPEIDTEVRPTARGRQAKAGADAF